MEQAASETTWVWPAVFGLVGVIVGSLITAGSELWRERQARRRRKKLAARRLRAMLGQAGHALDAAIDQADAAPIVGLGEIGEIWQAGMADLVDIDHDDWTAIDRCSNVFVAVHGATGPDMALAPDVVDVLRNLRQDARRGVDLLDRLAR